MRRSIEVAILDLAGHTLVYAADNSVCRRQSAKSMQSPVRWHQDYGTAFSECPERGVNCWIPLTPIGESEPSLELIPGSHVGRPRERIWYQEAQELTDTLYAGAPRICPRMQPGDCLIFDQGILHRTEPGKAAYRCSLEMRFSGLVRD